MLDMGVILEWSYQSPEGLPWSLEVQSYLSCPIDGFWAVSGTRGLSEIPISMQHGLDDRYFEFEGPRLATLSKPVLWFEVRKHNLLLAWFKQTLHQLVTRHAVSTRGDIISVREEDRVQAASNFGVAEIVLFLGRIFLERISCWSPVPCWEDVSGRSGLAGGGTRRRLCKIGWGFHGIRSAKVYDHAGSAIEIFKRGYSAERQHVSLSTPRFHPVLLRARCV